MAIWIVEVFVFKVFSTVYYGYKNADEIKMKICHG